MTDKQDSTKAEADLQKAAEAFAKTGQHEPGYRYRLVTSGGESHWVATKIEKKG